MKRNLLKPLILLFALLVGGLNAVWGQEVLYYTLDGTQTESGGNSGYAQAGDDVVQNDMSWSVMANCTTSPWRIGGKGITNEDRPVYSKTAMDAPITKVELEIGDITIASVNSITMIVASDAEFTTILETKSETNISESSTLTFTPTSPATSWATGAYYKFVFNVTQSTNSNKYIQLKSIKFYKAGTKTDPTITFNNGSVNVYKTLDLSSLFTSDSDGAVTYSITAGDDYATIEGSVLTGAAEGTVTIKAEQAATGSYNVGEATATITVNPALILSSIAITTEPTKTTYSEGETFDPTGMVVTATYNDNSTEDVTSLCTFSPATALTLSDTELTVGYTENGVTKTVIQAITVNEYVQDTDFSVTLNNAFFGSTATGNVTDVELTGKDKRTTITIYKNDGNKLYVNASQIRLYNKNTMVLEAPAGYAFTSIELLEPSTEKSWSGSENTSSPEGYDDDTKTWTGTANTVTITFGGTCRLGGLNIELIELVETKTIPVTKEYISFCSDKALDFTNVEGLEALVVTKINETSVSTEAVTTVPARVGVILHKTGEATSFNVPVAATATAPAKNYLVGVLEATTIGGNDTDYVLKDGKFMKANAGTLAAGKAYLKTDANAAPAPALTIGFGDEGTTGIRSIDNGQLTIDNVYYDLSGRRVAEPTKGVYIVNGKKVVIK